MALKNKQTSKHHLVHESYFQLWFCREQLREAGKRHSSRKREPLFYCALVIIYLLMHGASLLLCCNLKLLWLLFFFLHLTKDFAISAVSAIECFERHRKHMLRKAAGHPCKQLLLDSGPLYLYKTESAEKEH